MGHFVKRVALACLPLLVASSALSQIPVPGFQPGDEEKNRYFISHFDLHGYLFNSASADRNGQLYFTFADQAFINGQEVEWEHFFIYSVDRASGDIRYAFDLRDFPLLRFLQSLGISQMRLSQSRPASGNPSGDGRLTAEISDPLYADVTVPFLQGENLSFAQTLERLRDASGCDVIQTDDRLIIDSCP